ncbi:MAG: septation protein SepH, partial [Actinomycetota bacterium]|nr:septation protein SepH [Actinomycetota bacterium]
MRKLHLVGLTTDRDGLIFTARKGSKSGGYIVPLDDEVLAAIAEARDTGNGAPGDVAPVVTEVPKRLRSQSALTPREMQARLRAGRSIEEVAAEAGVDTEWVARFAVPILAEQAQVVELARGLVYAKPRLGESSQPLGASVLHNLADRGIFLPEDVADAAWSAFQLHDSVWMVRFRYRSRGREQGAQWEIDVPAGRLVARNRLASDLGYVDATRRRRALEPDDDAPDDDAPTASPPRRAGRRAARVDPRTAPKPGVRTRPAPAARGGAAKKTGAAGGAPAP